MNNQTLPLAWPWELELLPQAKLWLVEQLWLDQGVGIIGGEPKCCKSFMALDLAVSVASGASALREFKVNSPGHVLYFAAEDSLHIVRSRLDGICAAAGIDLKSLKLQLITAVSLRLDMLEDLERLRRTIDDLRPKLLILDPFVRLHRIDENNSGEVAPILAGLRELQRKYGLAVMLVHHAKKGASSSRAGQALRGSSEFHAWGDSNLYLRRDGKEQLNLSIEHRAQASFTGLPLKLNTNSPALALGIDRDRSRAPLADDGTDLPTLLGRLASATSPDVTELSVQNRIFTALQNSTDPLSLRAIRAKARARAETVSTEIQNLIALNRVRRTDSGYVAVP